MRRVRQGVAFSAAQRELYGGNSYVPKASNIAWEAAKLENTPRAWQLGTERNVDYMTGRIGERFVPALDAWRTFMRKDSEKALKWILNTFVPGLNAGAEMTVPLYGSPKQTLSWAQQEKPRIKAELSKARVRLGQMPDKEEWLDKHDMTGADYTDSQRDAAYAQAVSARRGEVANLEARMNAVKVHEQIARKLIASGRDYTPEIKQALGSFFDASTGHADWVNQGARSHQILEKILRTLQSIDRKQ
jgi:hypothetical protein